MAVAFKSAYVIPEYLADGINLELKTIRDQTYVGNSLLTILGSFWTSYYDDLDTLHMVSGAVTAMLGDQYLELFNQVLSSSIVDSPVHYTKQYDLYAFNSADAHYVYSGGTLQYIEFEYPGLENIQFFSSGLIDSGIILDAGNYFEIVDGTVRFYVDIFNDFSIKAGAYVYESQYLPDKQITVAMFWGSSITITETYLYDRYGRYLYHKENNSESYKAILTALQYFFTTIKSVKNLESVINILFNMPFSRSEGEVVEAIEVLDASGNVSSEEVNFNANATADTPEGLVGFGWYYRITTSRNVYFAPMYADVLVTIGESLTRYALIARVNRAMDYISDPDWYKNAKFPFELVEDLADFSVLDTPPEFEPYRPHRCDASITYSGDYFYTGEYASYAGINPFLGTRSQSAEEGGTEFEQHLYGIMDTILKYNILYLYTELNYENVDYYSNGNIQKAFEVIAAGIPSYLHAIFETFFKSELIDKMDIEDASELSINQELPEDLVTACAYGAYDGTVPLYNPIVYTYSGAFHCNGAARFYPYGGADGRLYSCEPEIYSSSVSLQGQEILGVLGLGETDTFGRKDLWHLYTGQCMADGSTGFTTYKESPDPDSVRINELSTDNVGVLEGCSSIELSTMTDEFFGGYTGTASFSSIRPVFYGADASLQPLYSGAFSADGSVTFTTMLDLSLAVPLDGSYTYMGYTDVQATYGYQGRDIVNITSDLTVTLTYAKQTLESLEQDTIGVLGLGEIDTFGRKDLWHFYTGQCMADGSTGFTTYKESNDHDSVIINEQSTDNAEVLEGAGTLELNTMTDEFFGGYTGTASFSSVRPVVYGADAALQPVYSGVFSADGSVPFTTMLDLGLAIPLDGSYTYIGYTDVQATYGNQGSDIVNITSDLTVTLTYM